MRWKLERRWPKEKYIIGRLYVEGEFVCNTLERPWKENKARVSCIPAGVYEVKLTYSPAFKRDLPLVVSVPGRSGIRIHRANKVTELQGCIAPGENSQPGMVLNSKKYELLLVEQMKLAALRKEPVFLTIE